MNETTSTKEMSAAQQIASEVVIVVAITAVSAVTFMAVTAVAGVIASKVEDRRLKKIHSKKH